MLRLPRPRLDTRPESSTPGSRGPGPCFATAPTLPAGPAYSRESRHEGPAEQGIHGPSPSGGEPGVARSPTSTCTTVSKSKAGAWGRAAADLGGENTTYARGRSCDYALDHGGARFPGRRGGTPADLRGGSDGRCPVSRPSLLRSTADVGPISRWGCVEPKRLRSPMSPCPSPLQTRAQTGRLPRPKAREARTDHSPLWFRGWVRVRTATIGQMRVTRQAKPRAPQNRRSIPTTA